MAHPRLPAGVLALALAASGFIGAIGVAEAASISGQLINKTPNGKGVGGAEVTLTLYRNEQEASKNTTATDGAGRFQFQNLSNKPGETYTVTVRYQEAEYDTERISLENASATRSLEIPVYDSTPDASRISVKVHHVVFAVREGAVRAEEVLVVQNTGDKAYVGSKEVAEGKRATLQFTPPADAKDITYGEGLMQCCVFPAEPGFVDTMDVKPGEREVTFSYTLAPAGGQVRFVRPVNYRTEAVEVFVPESTVQLSSEGFRRVGVVPGQDQKFVRFTGPSLDVPAAITLSLTNIPAVGGPWRPFAYGSVGILLLAGVAYPLLRRPRARAVPGSLGAARPAASSAPSLRQPASASPTELALRKVELVAALAELESGHEAGRIAEEEYRRLRQEKRQALGVVLAQLEEAGDAAATMPGA